MVPQGSELDNGVFAILSFATPDHIFTFRLENRGTGAIDARTVLRELAQRQLNAAGGAAQPTEKAPERSQAESEMIALLPATAPQGYGLTASVTAAGGDELTAEDNVDAGVVDFLNNNSITATRVWGTDDSSLFGAVSITRYPYDIFAAASVNEITKGDREVISKNALRDVPDVVAYRGTGAASDQIGTAFRRGDMKGVGDLAVLLARPNVDVHVLELMGGADVGGAAGPAIDESARRAYQSRIVELQREIDEAHGHNDGARAERAELELDALVEQLSEAFGLGGRSRATGSSAERARTAVTYRVRAAIRRLAQLHPDLGRHLRNSIRTGTWCSYRPETEMSWTIERRVPTAR